MLRVSVLLIPFFFFSPETFTLSARNSSDELNLLSLGEENTFSHNFTLAPEEKKKFHLVGLSAGFMVCESIAKIKIPQSNDLKSNLREIGDYEKPLINLPAEITFLDGQKINYRDNFTIRFSKDDLLNNAGKGRRTEYVVPKVAFGSMDNYSHAFMYFSFPKNFFSNEAKISLSCTLEKDETSPTLSDSELELHQDFIRKNYRNTSDPISCIIKESWERLEKIEWGTQKDFEQFDLEFSEILIKIRALSNNFTIENKHRIQLRDFYGFMRNKLGFVGHTEFENLTNNESFERRISDIKKLTESALVYMKDIEELFEIFSNIFKDDPFLEKVEEKLRGIKHTIRSIPVILDTRLFHFESSLEENLATRLFYIFQLKNNKDYLTPSNGPVAALNKELLFKQIEWSGIYILALLKFVDVKKLSPTAKKLLQASPGLHSSIDDEYMDLSLRNLSEDELRNLEANFYDAYFQPFSFLLIPKNQFQREKIIFPESRAEVFPKSVQKQLPVLPWLGDYQYRALPLEIFEPANDLKLNKANKNKSKGKPQKEKRKKRTKRKKRKNLNNNNMNESVKALPIPHKSKDVESINFDPEKTEIIDQLFIPPHDEIKIDIYSDLMRTAPDKDLSINDEISSDEDDYSFWDEIAAKKWDEKTKERYRIYLGKAPNNNSNQNANESNGFALLKSTLNLKGESLKSLIKIESMTSGLRWNRFCTLCNSLGISMKQPGKGSSHYTLKYKDMSLGTVWRPHSQKAAAPRLGPGQTKLIHSYFEKMISGKF